MKLTKFMVQGNLREDEGRLCLSLRKMELGSIARLNLFMAAETLAVLDLDGNFIKQIDEEVLKSLKSLEILSLKTNFIDKSSPFCTLSNLQELDLATNRLKVISNFSMLKQLNYLDLSHNKIEYIEKLPENLKIFKAAHNLLDEIDWMTPQLQLLDVRNNNISKLTPLGRGFPKLQILDLENNNLPMEEFSQFLLILERYTRGLQELVLEGNPMSRNPDYVLEILSRRPLQKLDRLIVTPYMIKAFTEKKQQLDIEQVIRQTKGQYMKRIKQEVQAKEKILSGLREKQMQVEHLFEQYRRNNSKQLADFLDYCDRGLLKDGKQLEYQRQLIKKFQKKLKDIEQKNDDEARQRKRRLYEEKNMLEKGTKLEVGKNQLYGQPNYLGLPTIDEVSSSRKDTTQREPIVEPIYQSKRPVVQALPLAEVFPRRSLNPPGKPPLPPNSSSREKLQPSSEQAPISSEQRPSSSVSSQQRPNITSQSQPQNGSSSNRQPQNDPDRRQPTDTTSQQTISQNKKNSSNRPSTTSILKTIQQSRRRSKLSKQSSNPSDPKRSQFSKESKKQSNPSDPKRSQVSKESNKQSIKQPSGSSDPSKEQSGRMTAPPTEEYTIFDPQCYEYLKKYYNQRP